MLNGSANDSNSAGSETLLRILSESSQEAGHLVRMTTRSTSHLDDPSNTTRLASLRDFEVLDSPPEAAFDDLADLARHICHAPIAMISLIDQDRQWFKSQRGWRGDTGTPLSSSFCVHAIENEQLMHVPDATLDDRFKNIPFVTAAPHIRFYAGAVLRTPDGSALGTICVLDTRPRTLNQTECVSLIKLSRQVMAQLELRRAQLLADELQSRSRLFKDAAGHDLKQPLQLMVMTIDRIRDKLTDSKDRAKLDYAVKTGMSMASRLDILARESTRSLGLGLPKQSAFPIAHLLDQLASRWQIAAQRKGLQFNIVPSSANVVSDPVLLDKILGNVIHNAVKFTPRGRILIGCKRENGYLWVNVIDTGPGIANEHRTEVLKPFYKLDLDSPGLGLGLSTVRRLAGLLDHRIDLKPGPTGGLHFSIRLPEAMSA